MTTRKKAVAKGSTSSNLPVDVQQKMQELAKKQAGTASAGTGHFIRATHTGFKFPDGTVADSPMQVVIVHAVSRNVYYDTPFVQGQTPKPPKCAAQGFAKNDDLSPMDGVMEPQSIDCRTCRWNQFGTAQNQKAKACANRKLLAVLPPDAKESDDMYIIDVSPTGMPHIDGFISRVTAQGLPTVSMAVDLKIIEAGSSVAIAAENEVPNENIVAMYNRIEEATKLLADTLPNLGDSAVSAPPKKKAVRKKTAARRR